MPRSHEPASVDVCRNGLKRRGKCASQRGRASSCLVTSPLAPSTWMVPCTCLWLPAPHCTSMASLCATGAGGWCALPPWTPFDIYLLQRAASLERGSRGFVATGAAVSWSQICVGSLSCKRRRHCDLTGFQGNPTGTLVASQRAGQGLRAVAFVQEAVAEDSDEPEALRIRGFKTTKAHGCSVSVLKGAATLAGQESEDCHLQFGPKLKRLPYTPL